MKKTVRISDVAKLARVSPATVSAVVNDRVGQQIRVSPETQERVWGAVNELGYVANPVARSLARGRKLLIGIFTYEAIFPIDHQNFFYPFLVGVEQEAEVQGYNLILFTSIRLDGKRSAYQNNANQLQLADGAIFLGLNEDKQELARLLEEGFPFVYIGRRDLPGHRLLYAGADYAQATIEIVNLMASHGHERFIYIRSDGDWEANNDREAGFRRGMVELGSMPTVLRLDAPHITKNRLRNWLADGITAFIVENDSHGHALMNAARAENLNVPRDFSMAVLGQPLSPYETIPDWTTFRIPRKEMGARAVQLLVQHLDEPENMQPASELLSCTVIEGSTIGRPPN